MPTGYAQDDARENRIVDLFNLARPKNQVRHGTDAILALDGDVFEFELKSATTKGGNVSTVRDLGPDHIAKWKDKHWIIGFFDGSNLSYCRYGSPDAMAPWIDGKWEYIRPDFELAKHVPKHITLATMYDIIGKKNIYTKDDAKRLHKNQLTAAGYREHMDLPDGYTPERMLQIFKDRARYVIERGSTLNNPKIQFGFFETWPKISDDHASTLRQLIRAWVKSKPPK